LFTRRLVERVQDRQRLLVALLRVLRQSRLRVQRQPLRLRRRRLRAQAPLLLRRAVTAKDAA